MNGLKVWRIARFEFLRFFKWKQEVITLSLMAGGFLIALSWPFVMALFESEQEVAFITERSSAPTAERIEFVRLPPGERERALEELGQRWDGVALVEDFTVELRVERRAGWQERAESGMREWVHEQKLSSLPLDGEQRRFINADPDISVTTMTETGEVEEAGDPLKGLVTGGIIMLMFVGLMTGAGLMMTAITTEKQQRVTEQLLTMITAQQWMDGKIVGITLHGLKAMATIGVSLFLLINLVAIAQGAGFLTLPLTILEFLNAVLFLLLGLLLSNAFLAGFSATIDDPNHSARSIIIFAPMAPAMLSFSVLNNPDGGLSVFLSLFPITSFAAMPIRLVEAPVPFWQWLLALVLLVGMIWSMRAMAARLFSMGIQMFGKEPGWKDIWRAMRGVEQK